MCGRWCFRCLWRGISSLSPLFSPRKRFLLSSFWLQQRSRVSRIDSYQSTMKFLLAFDFDYTVIDENSDTWIVKCAPEERLPIGIKSSYKKGHWTEYMGRVFIYLGDNGVKEAEMKRTMTTIPFTTGMTDLLGFIGMNKELFDCIIISDSNTVFIDWILRAGNFHRVFDEVFTNPATFSDTGYLTVQNFHDHSCAECPKNLCKRKVLEEFVDKQLQQGVNYTQIVYIGDGGNDLCPVKFLKKNDIAMPRQGFTLEKLISQMSQDLRPIECSVLVWSSGIEILSYLKILIKE
ncbi:pyridoxal phosphate phosphatase PHOSPHO2 isoform X1 [Alligator mississippiensis]|uniref:pyridoxal phosphate phosphatase PHOSPHO2 isoform X1 n=2 Tax=Alligator mississippiensis TaxID=8496 RepID=UPI0003D0BB12|nr:pyridoxal phosphate phosphatase PHOSPHO2 isoform X1 [Alligator mississippiensis]